MEPQETKMNTQALTKEPTGVQLTHREAEEYRTFKRQKKMVEIAGALTRSLMPIGSRDDVKRRLEIALRFRQDAVKLTPSRLAIVKPLLMGRKLKLDCVLGGEGETLTKVKAYEGRLAKRLGAQAFTLVLTPSHIVEGKYTEIKKEIKRVQWAVRPYKLKVWMDKTYPFTVLAKMARLVSEMGVECFCVPYFSGCQRLRYDLFGNCKLEISEVETLTEFQQMVGAGVERVVTAQVLELHSEWMKEVEKIPLIAEGVEKTESAQEQPRPQEKPKSTYTDLKFI